MRAPAKSRNLNGRATGRLRPTCSKALRSRPNLAASEPLQHTIGIPQAGDLGSGKRWPTQNDTFMWIVQAFGSVDGVCSASIEDVSFALLEQVRRERRNGRGFFPRNVVGNLI